jgi:Fe-S-cluster containining protein
MDSGSFVNDNLRADIERRLTTLQRLYDPVLVGRLDELERAKAGMDELISEEYEPYFSGNAALHLLSHCQRCGHCCDELAIALSLEDSRRIAQHLGVSLKRFMIEYTRPHTLKGPQIGNARIIKKKEDKSCVFYDPGLPGCTINEAKPQVCCAAYYLTKMNLLLCDQNHRFSSFPNCPADSKLRCELEEYTAMLSQDPEAMSELVKAFSSDQPEIRLFRFLLRLKGMEIYFGKETAKTLGRKSGMKRLPSNEELNDASFLYAVLLLINEKAES